MSLALSHPIVWLHQSYPLSFAQAASPTTKRFNRVLKLRVSANILIKIFSGSSYAIFD